MRNALIGIAVALVAAGVYVLAFSGGSQDDVAVAATEEVVETASEDVAEAASEEVVTEDAVAEDAAIEEVAEIAPVEVVEDEPVVVEAAGEDTATPVVADAAPVANGDLIITVAGEANGTITIDLFEDVAPLHAAQITAIAASGGYDGVVFHRVMSGFMAQTGDVAYGDSTDPAFDMRRAGTGGSEFDDIPLEASSEMSFTRGKVGMARSQNVDSANSQFFIMFDDGAFLDGQYTIVGEVTAGMDVVDQIKLGTGGNGAVMGAADVMTSVQVIE